MASKQSSPSSGEKVYGMTNTMMFASSFFSETSISLLQHRCVRLMWLPLPYCIQMTGNRIFPQRTNSPSGRRTSVTFSLHHRQLSNMSNTTPSVTNGSSILPQALSRASDAPTAGYEAALMKQVANYGEVNVATLRSSFPKGGERYCTDEGSLRFLVNTGLTTSQWENMEAFRAMQAVVVLINCTDPLNLSVGDTLSLIQSVFSANFKDKVCRCVVVNLPDSERANPLLKLSSFLCVSSRTDIKETAEVLVRSIASSFVKLVCSTLETITSPAKTTDITNVRTPLDIASNTETLKSAVLNSRLKKKKADLLLQVGAVDQALAAYGETQFGSNVDATWCSATLEGIAAARLLQLEPFLRWRAQNEEMLTMIQSDSMVWDAAAHAFVKGVQAILARMTSQLNDSVALYKNGSVPYSMRSVLAKETAETLAAKMSAFKDLLPRLEACVSAGTAEQTGDPLAYRVGADLKNLVEVALSACFSEIYTYLNESLRQLRHAHQNVSSYTFGGTTGSVQKEKHIATLKEREMETRLKMVSFTAMLGGKEKLADESSFVLGLAEKVFSELQMMGILHYFFSLCLQGQCYRHAVLHLIVLSGLQRKAGLIPSAILSLTKACFFSGVQLSIPELAGDIPRDPLYLYYVRATAEKQHATPTVSGDATEGGGAGGAGEDGGGGGGAAAALKDKDSVAEKFLEGSGNRLDEGNSAAMDAERAATTRAYHVPLLLQLLTLLEEAGEFAQATCCRLIFFILFRYAAFLDRKVQTQLYTAAVGYASSLAPSQCPSPVDMPLVKKWEALPLPPHLAPRTVSVGGPFFTFIDTQRLKLTCLSLNGKRIDSSVVWTVGDVGTVQVVLQNPFRFRLELDSMALQCYSSTPPNPGAEGTKPAESNKDAASPPLPVAVGGRRFAAGAPLAPTSYVLSDVVLEPLERRTVWLQVQPTVEGDLFIEGVECVPRGLSTPTPMVIKLPRTMSIPVLQRLPLVSCTISVSELEIFSGQSAYFSVRVVNCGQVPIERISLTAHSEACQLEECEGCKERLSEKDSTVALSKAALDAAARSPLYPGDVVIIPVCLQGPPVISEIGAHFVVFRVDCSLPHEKPTMPPNVPDAVPVFGVTPRRVMETRMRLFHAPSLSVTSVALTRDKRFVEVRIMNLSQRYSVALELSALPFTDLPDALLVAGAEFVVPPIAITSIPVEEEVAYHVPWRVRELADCTGELCLDFSVVAKGAIYAEPLDDCVVTVDFELPPSAADEGYLPRRHWESPNAALVAAHRGGRNPAPQSHSSGSSSRGRSRSRSRSSSSRAHGCGKKRSPSSTSASTFHSTSSSTLSGRPCPPSVPLDVAALQNSSFHELHQETAAIDRQQHPHKRYHHRHHHRRHHRRVPATTPAREGGGGGGGGGGATGAFPIVIPAVKPVQLRVKIQANWRRTVPLRIQVEMDHFFDVGILSGPVDMEVLVGAGGAVTYDRTFELFTFKTGEHSITVRITDSSNREIAHTIPINVQHGLGRQTADD